MTAKTYTTDPRISTPALAYAMAKTMSDAIASVGLVKVAVTGSTDYAASGGTATITASAPNGAGANVSNLFGWEVWRFNDTLQATAPIYIRINHYTQTAALGATSIHQMQIIIGTGVDTATGNVSGIFANLSGNNGTSAINTVGDATSYITSADGSFLALFHAVAGPRVVQNIDSFARPAFIIDRSRDASGNPTGDGLVIANSASWSASVATGSSGGATYADVRHVNYTTGSYFQSDPPCPSIPQVQDGYALQSGGGLTGGGVAYTFPWVVTPPDSVPFQPFIVSMHAGDDPNGSFNVALLGAVRPFMSVPYHLNVNNRWAPQRGGTGYSTVGIPWW